MPAQSEKAGGYYFESPVWGYYLKPTLDINLGSSVTSAPNNISIGVPIGLVYDFSNREKRFPGIVSFYIEGSPEMVADQNMQNILYYFSFKSVYKI